MADHCDDARLTALVLAYQQQAPDRVEQTHTLLAEFPRDARLHFMMGSMLIGEGRLIEGHASLAQAVALAPDYAIARFQLGLFQLTSGEADNALETWGRLDRLPDGHYLRHFIDGLRRLIRDDFSGCVSALRAGIAANSENPPLNNDMALIVEKCGELQKGVPADGADAEPLTETALVLQHFTNRSRLN